MKATVNIRKIKVTYYRLAILLQRNEPMLTMLFWIMLALLS